MSKNDNKPKENEMRDGLFAAALKVQQNAHAPYSNFKVGAAVLSVGGNVYSGCNVENAAYPEGLCAEASAIAAMVANGEQAIKQICIAGDGENLVTPCGGCRQKIREFGAADTPVFVCGPEGLRQRFTLAQLLPHSFGPNHLFQGDSAKGEEGA